MGIISRSTQLFRRLKLSIRPNIIKKRWRDALQKELRSRVQTWRQLHIISAQDKKRVQVPFIRCQVMDALYLVSRKQLRLTLFTLYMALLIVI